MSNENFNQQQIENMKRIGAGGGFVDTNSMSAVDKAVADKAVLDGKAGKK